MKYAVLLFTILLCKSCVIISGSYPFAEEYTFETPRNELINIIELFKKNNHEYKLIRISSNDQLYEYKDDFIREGLFFSIYFYLKDIDKTFHCIINMSDKVEHTPSILMLNAVSDGVDFRIWMRFNTEELSKKENKELKEVFEKRVLNSLGVTWKKSCW